MNTITVHGLTLRYGELNDISALVKHHTLMFREIYKLSGENVSDLQWLLMEKSYREKLQIQIPQGLCKAVVIESDSTIIASGIVTYVSIVPVPMDENCVSGFIHSIYTEPAFRGRGCCSAIVKSLLCFCKDNGIRRITLNASKAAKAIYEKLGFTMADSAMKLFLKE